MNPQIFFEASKFWSDVCFRGRVPVHGRMDMVTYRDKNTGRDRGMHRHWQDTDRDMNRDTDVDTDQDTVRDMGTDTDRDTDKDRDMGTDRLNSS
jgi:hypothetical protein